MRAGLFPANHKSRLISGTRSHLSVDSYLLTGRKQSLVSHSRSCLNNMNNKVAVHGNSLKILDPENVLKRGYTITSLNGKIIKKRIQLKKDDLINTRFSDGSVNSRVVK
jgi:exodeoxyribonuclease VII large subunit